MDSLIIHILLHVFLYHFPTLLLTRRWTAKLIDLHSNICLKVYPLEDQINTPINWEAFDQIFPSGLVQEIHI